MKNTNNGLLNINVNFVLFYIMVLMIAFDHKTIDGQSKIFITILSVFSIIIGLTLVLKKLYIRQGSEFIIISSFLFLIIASINGIIRTEDFYLVFSEGLPILFLIIGMVTISNFKGDEETIKKIINIILLFLFTSAFFRFFFGFSQRDVDIESARYFILSPTIIMLFAYGVTSFLFQKNLLTYSSLVVSLFIVFISLTRTYFLVYIVIFLSIYFLGVYKNKNMNRALTYSVFLSIILVFFIYLILPNQLELWIQRLFTSSSDNGFDLTLTTRIAETSYQIQRLTDSFINLLFGLGMGAETQFNYNYWLLVSTVLGEKFEFQGHGYGHNTYIGTVFLGGIFGFIFIISLLVSFYIFMKKVKVILDKSGEKSNSEFIIVWGVLSIIGYLVYGFFGGIFGDRLNSFAFGISYGLVFLGLSEYGNERVTKYAI